MTTIRNNLFNYFKQPTIKVEKKQSTFKVFFARLQQVSMIQEHIVSSQTVTFEPVVSKYDHTLKYTNILLNLSKI